MIVLGEEHRKMVRSLFGGSDNEETEPAYQEVFLKLGSRGIMGSDEVNSAVRKEIVNQFNSNSVAIPSLQYFRKGICYFVDTKLLDLYEEVMKGLGVTGWENVNPEVRIAQATLFDGPMFVYDASKNTYSLVSCNSDIGAQLKIDISTWGRKIVEKNLKGSLVAFRIIASYPIEGEVVKVTYRGDVPDDLDIDEIKPDGDAAKRFTLIPYVFIENLAIMIHSALKYNKIVKVVSDREHFLTLDEHVIGTYNDGPAEIYSSGTVFCIDEGYFYAPEITRTANNWVFVDQYFVNIFDISTISWSHISVKNVKARKARGGRHE